jgi:predicted XRE-type DNA-binding protein
MSQNERRTKTTPLGELGSGNVFADLGLPNAEEELFKAKLVAKICDVIEKRGVTQVQAGALMNLPQSKVSELCNGRTENYSVERLCKLLTRIGVGVSVVLEDQPNWNRGNIEVRESQNDARHDYDAERQFAPGM